MHRDAMAELRRAHHDAPWTLAGVVVDAVWSPVRPGIRPADLRVIEAGNVRLEHLPPFLARSAGGAVSVALEVARMAGYPDSEIERWRWIDLADVIETALENQDTSRS
jgi:hypothetical protein